MGIVVESPVRDCSRWLRQPLGPIKKAPYLSMRYRLDKYGYAPGDIEYCGDELMALALLEETYRRSELVVSDRDLRRGLGWLNIMKSSSDGVSICSMLASLGKVAKPEEIQEVVKGTKYGNVTQVQGQTVAVESDKSVELNQKLIALVHGFAWAPRSSSGRLHVRAGTHGGGSCPPKQGARAVEDARPGATADFAHGALKVTGNHAVRLEKDRLHVLASSMPRMQPPAGASHVVFKSLSGGLACLLLPDDTWTNCDGGGGKFRAEKLYVVAVWNFGTDSPADSDTSNYDRSYRYVAGKLATARVNKDPKVVCGAGLHFFLSIKEANKYYHRAGDAKVQQAQAYFEQMIADLPDDWSDRDTKSTPAAAENAVTTLAVVQPELKAAELAESIGEDITEKCTYSADFEPTAYLATRADREQEVRRAQLRSFRVRLRYSKRMFRAHCSEVRDMLSVRDMEMACSISERIDSVRDYCVEGIEEAAAVFKDADEFRFYTLKTYVDPNVEMKGPSMHFAR